MKKKTEYLPEEEGPTRTLSLNQILAVNATANELDRKRNFWFTLWAYTFCFMVGSWILISLVWRHS